MLTRRLLGLLAAALLFPITVHAQNTVETYSDTVPLAEGGSVTVDNHEGSITVTAWDRSEVQYQVRVEAERGADHPERTTVSVNRSSQRLDLKTEHDDSGNGGFFDWGGSNIMPVHYTLQIPATARLTIDDHESNIEVTGLRAELRIDTHEGPITIARQQGAVRLDTHEGPMRLRNVTGNVTIDTHEGETTVSNLRGGFTMDAHDGRADVTFATFNEDIRIDSHEGTFTLALPAAAGFDLATDFDDDAALDSDFDLRALRIVDEDDEDEVNYQGAVNGGGPQIRLSSHEGRFRLRKR